MSIPTEIFRFFANPATYSGNDGLPARLEAHVAICVVTLAIASGVALPLGVVLGRARRGGVLVTSLANAARAVPVLGVLILFAVGPLGVGTSSAVASLVIFALPPLVTNAYTGVREVDPEIRTAATAMGMSGRQRLWRVELPVALPLVAAGVRTATVQVWATATLAAIVGSGGLGRYIVDGYAQENYGEVYGGVIVVAVTAVLLDAALGRLQLAVRAAFGGESERAAKRMSTVVAG